MGVAGFLQRKVMLGEPRIYMTSQRASEFDYKALPMINID